MAKRQGELQDYQGKDIEVHRALLGDDRRSTINLSNPNEARRELQRRQQARRPSRLRADRET